ncbi:MAG: rod shape-determining protein RodA [Lachnospiraceae bacterium]|nr:rod shape-determining protein RodA [Lachnospiraceae bacterium]
MFTFRNYNWRKYDVGLLVIVSILVGISAFLLYASGDLPHMKRQIAAFAVGLVIAGIVSVLDYHFVSKMSFLYYFVVMVMLFMVRFTRFGDDLTTGAYRWLNLGFMEIQVSELAKIALILILADYFMRHKDNVNQFRYLMLAVLIAAAPTFLIMIQTDLSSSMVMIFIFVIMYFVAGLSYKIIGLVTLVGVPAFVALLWYVQQPWQVILSTKQQQRILGFFDPETYAQSYMYQQNQSVAAISSGGLLGKFIEGVKPMTGLSSKVYVNESDFIFSVAGEVLGFLGCLLLIILLALIIVRCVMIARNARDKLGYYIAIGVSAMFMFQFFVNIGVATALLPNTGLPLPFLSYGMSSLISSMIAIGLILNVGLQQQR